MKEYFQKMGRSLMLPIAILPAASILVGVGNWLASLKIGFVAQFMIAGGNAILGVLPYLFAIGLALGMSKKRDGAAALAGFVALTIPLQVLSPANMALLFDKPVSHINPAFSAIQGNVLIGIIAGLVAAAMFDNFSEVKLPQAISFFSGKRLVPILTAIVMLVVSLLMLVIWPPIFTALVDFGKLVVNLGPAGAGLYGFFNRLLIPTGLHHALNSVFWFNVANINDIFNFLHGTGVKGITGRYQAGFFPIMMFGLPAGALAIYHQARPSQKKRVGSLMLASAFASFFTGVTEPLEFSFMFVAWPLYVVHAALTGLSMFIAASFHWTNGFAFSAGLVDFVLDYHLPLANKPYMLLVLGLFMAILYYVSFTFMIRTFNLMTPGRNPEEDDLMDEDAVVVDGPAKKISSTDRYAQLAEKIWLTLGDGSSDLAKERLTETAHCTTRLRYKFTDTSAIDVNALKRINGVAGVNVLNEHQMQIVIGPEVQFIADNIDKIKNGELTVSAMPLATEEISDGPSEPATTPATKLTMVSVANGTLKPLADVPDETFASKMLGDGFAVVPNEGQIVAPVAGEVTLIFPTQHAIGIKTTDGTEVLVHMGVNTVELNGTPFDVQVTVGQQVAAGETLAQMDLIAIAASRKATDVIVVVTNHPEWQATLLTEATDVERGVAVVDLA
ncbi:N-acetylglucosamine-specific PTS transporter subunit IIBC [Periweissella ghanensis]|uniref:PTS system glucose-specific EIICBA component n=1 Tax=Periweissella ghanensis TaxID=467997 RepID=A0ABM8ZBN5_9LACO|nr:N-acetylglucosamine-specific PTS transporter subunit IIBC [Periweissella ghanensis]MCM0601634.1 PTS transporter subunit EIIC [Periweissella ghanensis]CAH0418713.1 PTS system glucose-specific EIICBA component [Periweissella ghanensis]